MAKSRATYIPNKNIQSLNVKNGKRVTEIKNKDILDGAYVRKGVKFRNGGTLEVKDREDVWYLTYIDPTHFYLSNTRDFKGSAYHVGQFRDRPFYNEVNEWLKSHKDKYKNGGMMAKGGEVAKIKSALAKTNNSLVVVCKSEGNPDYRQYAPISDTKYFPVNTLQEAAQKCVEYISENDLGGGNWTGGDVYDINGKVIAHISYNGRVWSTSDYDDKSRKEFTGEELTKSYYKQGGKMADGGNMNDDDEDFEREFLEERLLELESELRELKENLDYEYDEDENEDEEIDYLTYKIYDLQDAINNWDMLDDDEKEEYKDKYYAKGGNMNNDKSYICTYEIGGL